jgi:hypothetical protein
MNALCEEAVAVAPERESATARKLSEKRVLCRALASRLLAAAVSAHTSAAAFASSLDVSRAAVDHWCDPEHGAAVTLGDLLAGRRSVARSVLLSALAVLDERDASEVDLVATVLRAVGDLGQLGELLPRMRSGQLDDAERARAMRGLDALSDRIGLIRKGLEVST